MKQGFLDDGRQNSGFMKRLQRLLLMIQGFGLLPKQIRRWLLRAGGMSVGHDTVIEKNSSFGSGNVSVGEGTYINKNLLTDGHGQINIGANVSIAPSVQILTGTHEITGDPNKRAGHDVTYFETSIEDGVWIGASATILPGTTIKQGCVIGAGAVVTQDTEANGLYVGVPAERKRDL